MLGVWARSQGRAANKSPEPRSWSTSRADVIQRKERLFRDLWRQSHLAELRCIVLPLPERPLEQFNDGVRAATDGREHATATRNRLRSVGKAFRAANSCKPERRLIVYRSLEININSELKVQPGQYS